MPMIVAQDARPVAVTLPCGHAGMSGLPCPRCALEQAALRQRATPPVQCDEKTPLRACVHLGKRIRLDDRSVKTRLEPG